MQRDYSIIKEENHTGIPGEKQIFIVFTDGKRYVVMQKLTGERGFTKCTATEELLERIFNSHHSFDQPVPTEAIPLLEEVFENGRRLKSLTKQIYEIITESQEEEY